MRCAMALVLGGVCASSVAAISPDPKDLAIPPGDLARAQDLVHRLGSEIYREREEAQTELARMGRTARPALLAAASSDPDPEVRFRCSRLLPHAGAEDLKARIEVFQADADGKFEHYLPGLQPFRKLAGSDKAARDLYVEMVKSPTNASLLEALDKNPIEAGRVIADRRAAMWGMIQQRAINGRIEPPRMIPLSDIACLLFAETLVPTKDIPRNNAFSYIMGVQFLHQKASTDAINGINPSHAEAYRRIIGHWIDTREDPVELSNLAHVAGNVLRGFKETPALLKRIIHADGVIGYPKASALGHLFQLRGKEEPAYFRSLFTNDAMLMSVFFPGAQGNPQGFTQHQCLIRDMALSLCLRQAGLKMSDYGFIFPQNAREEMVAQNPGYVQYAFPSDEARAAAFVKFGFWRMKEAGKEPQPAPKK